MEYRCPLSLIEVLNLLLNIGRHSKKGPGTCLKLNNVFHPQMNGQVMCTRKIMEGMLRDCIIYFKGNLDYHLPLIDFAYNNSYHSSICMTVFDSLYCRTLRSLIDWFKVDEFSLIDLELVHEATKKVQFR